MTLFIIGIVCLIASILFLICYDRKLKRNGKRNSELIEQNANLWKTNERLDQDAAYLKQLIKQLESDKKIAEESRAHAVEMAGKELELELAKQKEDYHKQLNEELEKMKSEHSLVNYQRLVEQLEAKIEERRSTLRILQDQQKEAEEKDDFIKAHSMGLSIVEKSDISLIRGFAPKLAFKEVMYKLIWSQYYQSKLQALRKSLDADKTTGIYKITNTKNNKVYIGQAVDIGDRWTQHVKCGLGINVGTPNKFYSAMMEDGPESFTYEVLEVCDKDKLNERERYWIDFYNSVSRGYNTKVGG